MSRYLLAALLALTMVPGLRAQDAGAASITPADIARRVGILADDSMGGRFTPSPELDRAAAYIAAEFRRLGLTPAGDGTAFVQRYPLGRLVPDTVGTTIRLGAGPAIRRDAVHVSGRYTTAPVTGPVVLLTGIVAPKRPLALAGKIVIAAVPTEGTGQPDPRARRLLRALAEAQPAAVLIPVDSPDEVWTAVVRQQFRTGVGPVWQTDSAASQVQVRDRAIGAFLRTAGVDLAAARRSLGPAVVRPLGVEATVASPALILDAARAPNVAGLLRGSDPAVRDEIVVVSAHMDHLGVTGRGSCRAVGADSICNGADDNASGTASVLELAEAFAAVTPRPRRSILFLTVSGEERGLWGSDYFTAHSPVPIARMVADLNLDMVGRNWPDTIAVIGREQSDLGATLDRVAAAHPELDMQVVGDLWPQEHFYDRSDHYNFARRGVPILFFFNGTHAEYHRPSDEPAKIDAEKQARLTRLIYYLTREIADRPS